jgi:hypothetical protein
MSAATRIVPPFCKGGQGGFDAVQENQRRKNPPHPPFAKGGSEPTSPR